MNRSAVASLVPILAGLILAGACQSPRQWRAQQARTRENARFQEEQLTRMSQSMREVQEQYGNSVRQVTALQGQVAAFDSRLQSLNNEVQSLKQQLAEERQARAADMDRMLGQVAKETAAAIRSASPPAAASGPATAGEFYEYVVEPGATLSAIAKAYGNVSVDAIRKANRLKDDNIRVGQKLYIPKR